MIDRETGGTWDPLSHGAADERGCFQILPSAHLDRVLSLGYTLEDLWDPTINGIVALDIWRDSSWIPWTTAPLCID